MCGRLNVHTDPLARVFVLLTGRPFPGETSPNVAPTEQVWVIRAAPTPGAERAAVHAADERGAGARGVDDEHATQSDRLAAVAPGGVPAVARLMRWWLVPFWSVDAKPKYSMFNARSDSLRKSRAFRAPFERRRCLVPVAGFYEWIKEGARKLPQHVTAADGSALLLAGIWDHWQGADQAIDSFAIVTTDVHPNLAFLHTRQPAMLSAADAPRWLDRDTELDAAYALLTSDLPVDLAVTPVSEFVNNARHKGAQCTAPLGNPRFVTTVRAQ